MVIIMVTCGDHDEQQRLLMKAILPMNFRGVCVCVTVGGGVHHERLMATMVM